MEDMKGRRKCPEETANPINKLCFWWMLKLFWKGAKRDFTMEDIYAPRKIDESEYLGDCLERSWNIELKKLQTMEYTIGKDGKKSVIGSTAPSLFRAIFRAFWWQYLSIGLWIALNIIGIRTLHPILQKLIIGYFSASGTRRVASKEDAFLYAAGLVLTTLMYVTINHHTEARATEVAMRLRVASSTLVYRKILRLSKTSLNNTTPGQIINLLSNDVARFDTISALLNYIWIMPCQIIVIGAIMWQSIGIVTVVGLGSVLILIVPLQLMFNKLTRIIRASIAARTDRRIQLMSELISGIQIVKMYAWEKLFEREINTARKLEMKSIRRASYLQALFLGMMMVTDIIALLSSLLAYVFLGNTLSAEITFPLVSYFNILQSSAGYFFPLALIQAGEAAVSIGRLQTFLLLDELSAEDTQIQDATKREKISSSEKQKKTMDLAISSESYREESQRIKLNEETLEPVTIEMQRVCANWIIGQLPPILCEVSLTVQAGNLCALVGQVASGKSSLLNVILGELPLGSGTIRLRQWANIALINEQSKRGFVVDNPKLRISYASQEPWLLSGTVRDNVLFGQTFCPNRYDEVTKICALKKDIKDWPHGDQTIVGENGITLSGGQKARINLARAVYREADLYLIDDPLSSVDPLVARHLFDKCINGFLRGKTRVLATHKIQFLKPADTIVVLDRGVVKAQGRFEELDETSSEFRVLIDQLRKTGEKSRIVETKDNSSSASSSNKDEKKHEMKEVSPKPLANRSDSSNDKEDAIPYAGDRDREEINKGLITGRIYMEYLKASGSYFVLCSVIFTIVLGQVVTSTTDYWITYWTNVEEVRTNNRDPTMSKVEYKRITNNSIFNYFSLLDSDGLLPTDLAIDFYAFLVFCSILINITKTFFFMYACTVVSRNLHKKMFARILHASMRFFNTNPSGRVLNRFSKDVGIMDETLPRALLDAFRLFLTMMSVLLIIICLNPWMIIPLIFLGTLFYCLRQYYLRTSQNFQRIEGISKSPVFSQVKATLNGLTTIRSSGPDVICAMRKKFDSLQDVHSGVWYLTTISSSTFGFYLDLMSCSFIGSVCFSFILLDDGNIFGGSVGLSISQALLLNGVLQYAVKTSAEAMTQMTSIERIVQYVDLPTEGSLTSDNPPPTDWPMEGRITLKNLFLRYRSDEPPVLKDLNVEIEPGWKVGVVGRTGAGKSSLISALFRLENSGLEGTIVIDDRDTSTLGLHELRSKISIIPQEPVLFSGNIRYNLDPFGCYTDENLWRALKEVELDELTLDRTVMEGGSNFSVGQKQLICLARAILKNNRILMLDEATANIDSRTDSLIQITLRTRFANHTVITVAHRLNTVIDSDRIIVMDSGERVEFGCPNVLLRDNPDGPFSRMVSQAGSSTANNLTKTAKKACHRNPNHNCEKEEIKS